MKQRDLEIRLQKLEGFAKPKARLEQYPTPARVAADILYTAYAHGDIGGKRIIDLGCGTGIFSIGASFLGASDVTGLDIDEEALAVAGINAATSGCDPIPQFICGPVESASGVFDTCIMNPPFGSQNRHADIPFLEKAMELSSVVYSMHNSGTAGFLRKRAGGAGWHVESEKIYRLEIRHTFDFHNKEMAYVDVTMMRMVQA